MVPDYKTNTRITRLADKFIRQMLARRETNESVRYRTDEVDRAKHIKGAQREFKSLLTQLQPLADQVKAEIPDKDKLSLQRRGRLFNKLVKTAPTMVSYLDTWIGTEAQHPQAYSWRGAIIYQARDVLVYGKLMRDALAEVEKETFKGFEAITMAQAQAPIRNVVPPALREFLPANIVVEVDAGGTIAHITDRFENEHLTLGKKIEKMRRLVLSYNAIAKRVKRDFKSSNEVTKMAALITAIIMETGIRPGKAGNGVIKTVAGEQIEIETFGAITLGPKHVKFVRDNFASLEFIGKKGSKNTAEIADGAIIKVLQDYVNQALKKGSPYVFVTGKGVAFTYTDLQRYFRENFVDLAPTDFRKLRATEAVQAALRNEQAALYDKIKTFAKGAKGDLKERIVQAIVDTFEAAIAKSQQALSHDSAKTTVKAYINPEIILRFLSTGRVDDNLGAAILGGDTKLSFDPKVFLDLAKGKRATDAACNKLQTASVRAASLGDLLVELRTDLEGAGVKVATDASVRLAQRWVQGAGTEKDITDNLRGYTDAYNDFLLAMEDARTAGWAGNEIVTRVKANKPWTRLINLGYKIANGVLSVRSIPPNQVKAMELAYRLFSNSRQMPKDVYKWWDKNQKLLFLILASIKWPPKQEGTDELFQLGAFRVVNTIGASGAKLDGVKKVIEGAEKLARKNPIPGFTRTVYGNIHIVARIAKAHHAAWYFASDDSLYLRVGVKQGMTDSQVVVHELGHRYWTKFADKSKKEAWAQHHRELEEKDVPKEDIPLPKVGDPVPEVKITGIKGDPIVSREDGANFYFEAPYQGTTHTRTFSISRYKLFSLRRENVKRVRNFPTGYAATNAEEHFCEALALAATGSLPDEHAIPFKATWG